jgi:hypothetical protein
MRDPLNPGDPQALPGRRSYRRRAGTSCSIERVLMASLTSAINKNGSEAEARLRAFSEKRAPREKK